ncbi:tetratricopeptide repeat protein [Pseudomonas sp. SDO5532_S415]
MRRIDLRLSVLQLGSMLVAVVLTVVLVALYHHLTEDYYIPLPEYLGSIKLVAPPMLVLISSYVLTFLVGEKMSDAPRIMIRYLKDYFFQSSRLMVFFVFCVSLLSVLLLYRMVSTAPPHYVSLVEKLLGGEQDRQQLILNEINLISLKNDGLSRKLQLVNDVFSLRSKWNFLDHPANTTEPRILVRALELDKDADWRDHPLRIHALAEAYSMWAQAAKSSSYPIEVDGWKHNLKKSIDLYEEVINSSSPLATPLMKLSAINNSGNAYYYAHDLNNALLFYRRVLEEKKNLSTAGNVIALLLLQKKYEEAARVGDEYMEWAKLSGSALTEGSSYSAVVGNSAFAHLIMGDDEVGAKLMIEAYDLESDDLNALNLSAALALSGQKDAAVSLMARHFKYPVLDVADQVTRVTGKYNHCYYLVEATINNSSAAPLRAANLYMYLGLAKTKSQLESETSISVGALINKVEEVLQKDSSACKDLLMIPKFKELLYGA